MWPWLPEFGSLVLVSSLVACAHAIAQAIGAVGGGLLASERARSASYGACALIGTATLLLIYAFLSHDFRLAYVSAYSDRATPTLYLLAGLWGGQDGSLLFWAALQAAYSAAVLRWLPSRFRPFEPVMTVTLMTILGFFVLLMVFTSNPFERALLGPAPDGEGLHPLLMNPWMALHPPTLYLGFVGFSVPFAFAVAALVHRDLDRDWLLGVRRWMLVPWFFLSVGNVFGMVWAYEELGWGGFWAWDPVENASALPWFTATAFLHSTMIQERRGMLKIWNVVLVCVTFLLTIFGTFLTRSGLVSSVHSFAQSDTGGYFLVFMALLVGGCAGLMIRARASLRSHNQIEALMSREASFVANNWALFGLMLFVAGATLFPKLSEWWYGETVTLGPRFFNRWAVPLGLLVYFLMGIAPLFGWRKTSRSVLLRMSLGPLAGVLLVSMLFLVFGASWGMPAILPDQGGTGATLDRWLGALGRAIPLLTVALTALNLTVVGAEWVLSVKSRRAQLKDQTPRESIGRSLFELLRRYPRRYGGYTVHLGIVCVFVGVLGTCWSTSREVSLEPGQTVTVADHSLRFVGSRDCPGEASCRGAERTLLAQAQSIAELEVRQDSRERGRLLARKVKHAARGGTVTTEVGMVRGLFSDVYVVLGAVDEAGRAQLQIHINRLVSFIWIGLLVVMFGTGIALLPDLSPGRLARWRAVRHLEPTAKTHAGGSL
jgi:cytochrome c-type biogenesis protein CcmF